MRKKPLCGDCIYLERDGMAGIWCGVGGNNTKYNCSKFHRRYRSVQEVMEILKKCDPDETVHIKIKALGQMRPIKSIRVDTIGQICLEA